MASSIGFYVGAIVAAFLLSRLFMALTRRWASGLRLIVIGNGLSLMVAIVIGGFGFAGEMGRDFVPLDAFIVYAPAQLVILLLDLWRLSRRAPEG